jgi:hypothetical protein
MHPGSRRSRLPRREAEGPGSHELQRSAASRGEIGKGETERASGASAGDSLCAAVQRPYTTLFVSVSRPCARASARSRGTCGALDHVRREGCAEALPRRKVQIECSACGRWMGVLSFSSCVRIGGAARALLCSVRNIVR